MSKDYTIFTHIDRTDEKDDRWTVNVGTGELKYEHHFAVIPTWQGYCYKK